MKKCLLIGGAGFIGSNLTKCLVECGYAVTVLDIVENPVLYGDKLAVKYVRGNYFSDEIDAGLLEDQDVVFLLACSVAPKSSMEMPEICYGEDITKMIELLDLMRCKKVKRLVFISSGGTVYGNNDAELLAEDMSTFPINHYGIMKLTQEKILIMYNQLYGMDNVIFRLANPYGPGQRDSTGVGAVTSFMKRILRNEPIHIYGEGETVRDYIYIEDVIRIICNFLEKENVADFPPIYNIGTGQGVSLMEVVKIIEEVTGKDAKIVFLEKRNIDVKSNVLNMSKLLRIIGTYECLSIYEGIGKYYCWMKERKI